MSSAVLVRDEGKFAFPAHPRSVAAIAIFLCLGFAASSSRIVLAPGFEFYLGPLFYLLAYRVWGVRAGVIAAAFFTAPTYWWWGHFFSIGLACAHVMFLDRMRKLSLASATLLFHATIGGVATFVFTNLHYHATPVAIGAVFLRKVIFDVTVATLVDIFAVFCVVERSPIRVSLRRTISLASLIEAATMLLVAGAALLLFLNEVRQFQATFAKYRDDVRLSVQLDSRGLAGIPAETYVTRMIDLAPVGKQQVLLGRGMVVPTAIVKARLGCKRIDDGTAGRGPNDRNTFAYWYAVCSVGTLRAGPGVVWYASPMRPLAEHAYRALLAKMLQPLVLLLVALGFQRVISRAMQRSLDAWAKAVGQFGVPALEMPRHIFFSEFETPLSSYIIANNRYAAFAEERAALSRSVAELNATIDLRLIRDLRYDETNRRLIFTDLDMARGERHTSVQIHPNDAVAFSDAAKSSDPLVEFRLAEGAAFDWYLLMAHEPNGEHSWRSGCFFRLRRPRMTDPGSLHQARLIELGGMASALSHELRQPLFTMSLAAENGTLLCAREQIDVGKVRAKFERVREQVSRASEIIRRISSYARVDSHETPPAPLMDAVNAAAVFMRPLLVQENVQLRVQRCQGGCAAAAPRVALEQILVNAIQNSVDAIASRRQAESAPVEGVIDISFTVEDHCASIRVTDNGTGLDPAIAVDVFDAFLTTKAPGKGTGLGLYICRQIMNELSGSVEIRSRPHPERGAVLTLRFPRQDDMECVARLAEGKS